MVEGFGRPAVGNEVVARLEGMTGVRRHRMTDQVSGPAYATAVGLLRWGTKLRHHGNGHAPVGAGASAAYARTVRWIKDFF